MGVTAAVRLGRSRRIDIADDRELGIASDAVLRLAVQMTARDLCDLVQGLCCYKCGE